MAECRLRVTLVRSIVSFLVVVTAGRAAWADDGSAGSAGGSGSTGSTSTGRPTSAGVAGAAAGTGSTGNGTAGAGTTGPTIATPSVLPATGIGPMGPDVRLGNLGDQLSGSLSGRQAEPGGGRAWSIAPAIGLSEEYVTGQSNLASSGISGSATNQFITIVQPSIVVSGDTTRLHGDLAYAPQIQLYSRDGNQNQIEQNFNGRLLMTLLPQTLFLDLRGSGAVQAVTAGQAPNQTTSLGRGNTTQTYSFSAAPYAVHRFGEWGTGEIGGAVGRTTQNALQPAAAQPLLASLADMSNQNVTTTSGHVAFATGEAFSRYSGTALAQATNFDGTGVLRGAYRDTVSLDSGYALTRTITALGTIGWEKIHYAGTSPVDIDDAIWNVGIRLEPNADSRITVRYGHQDGLNSLTVDAVYQPTARTRIFARYSTGLTTQAEQLQNALATSDLDALGNPVDHTTGAPLVAVGNFFGTQNSLYKTTLGSLTSVLLLPRDVLSASVNSQTQTLISASNLVGLANGSNRGVYGTLSWSHALRPNLQSTAYVEYGTQQNGGSGEQQLVVASAALSYALSPTLSGQLQYSYNQTFGGSRFSGIPSGFGGAGSGGQSLILLSLTKSF